MAAAAACHLGVGVLSAPTSKIPVSAFFSGMPIRSYRVFSAHYGTKKFQGVKAFFNVNDEPLIKEAFKEPVAFFGGVFAGLLRLDLNEDPLREWIARTAEAAGFDLKDSDKTDEGVPEEIQIE